MSTQYAPLKEARRSPRVRWYRCPIPIEKLRELSRPNDFQAWCQTGGHIALFTGTGVLVYLFLRQQIWLGFALALFAHGTVASFFNGPAPHELGHGTVFRTKWLNKLFMYLFSMVGWWDPFDYAVSHTYHHRFTLHPDGDREVLLPIHPSVGRTFLLQLFTINLFTQPGRIFGRGGLIPAVIATTRAAFGRLGSTEVSIHEWLEVLHRDQPEEHRKSMWFARLTLLFHGSVVVVSIVSGLWVLALLITVAPFIGNWLAYFVGLPQHCGLRDNISDFRKCVRSVKLDPLSEFLYWRMNWHTEHHMYAGGALLQSKEVEPRNRRGYAGTAHSDRRLAGDARYLETAANRPGLPIRYPAIGRRRTACFGEPHRTGEIDRGDRAGEPEVAQQHRPRSGGRLAPSMCIWPRGSQSGP